MSVQRVNKTFSPNSSWGTTGCYLWNQLTTIWMMTLISSEIRILRRSATSCHLLLLQVEDSVAPAPQVSVSLEVSANEILMATATWFAWSLALDCLIVTGNLLQMLGRLASLPGASVGRQTCG